MSSNGDLDIFFAKYLSPFSLQLGLSNQTIGVGDLANTDLIYNGNNFKGCELIITYDAPVDFVSVAGEQPDFQAYALGDTISVAYMEVGSIDNPGKIATLTFEGAGEGVGNITIVSSEVRGLTPDGNSQVTLEHSTEVTGYINVDGSPPTIDEVKIINETLDTDSDSDGEDDYIKDSDNIKVEASGNEVPNADYASGIQQSDVTADLSGFYGGSGHAADTPTIFNYEPNTRAWSAVWTVNGVDCSPENGAITVTVNVKDLVGNEATPATDSITADNTLPGNVENLEMEIGSVTLKWNFKAASEFDANFRRIEIQRITSSELEGSYNPGDRYPWPNYAEVTYTYKSEANITHSGGETPDGEDETPNDNWQDPSINQYGEPRDIYLYTVYARDWAGNTSAVKAHVKGTSYYLGDFDGSANNLIDGDDLVPFANAFGLTKGDDGYNETDHTYADCDIGPTENDGRFDVPEPWPDYIIDFEDLMIFAMNFNNVPPAPMYQPPVFPENTPLVSIRSNTTALEANESFTVLLKLSRELKAKGVHLRLNYDRRYFEVVSVSEGNLGLTFFSTKDKGGVLDINVAALGSNIPLADETIAVVEFRTRGSAPEATMYLSKIDIRGVRNERADDKLAKIGKVGLTLNVGKPDVTKIFRNYPNPFNPETWIPFQLEKSADVLVKIYDVQGRSVKTMPLGNYPAGYYLSKDKAVHWNGRNDSGERVSSGIYFYQFLAGEVIKTARMVVLK